MAKRRYHPGFPIDLRNAVLHFDGISVALGERFRKIVRERLAAITADPELYARLSGEIRASRLPRFPYIILYTFDHNSVFFIRWFLAPVTERLGSIESANAA